MRLQNENMESDVVDLAKDPPRAGALASSTTQELKLEDALELQPLNNRN